MLLIANLIVTSIMVGIIWIVQLLVYPAFKIVGEARHRIYHEKHMRDISPLVAPLMVLEFALAVIWMIGSRETFQIMNLSCAIILWLSTFLIQVPLHQKLKDKFDIKHINALIKSNWIRTIIWTFKLTIIIYAASKTYQ